MRTIGYRGTRSRDGRCAATVVFEDAVERYSEKPLPARRELRNHSPDGFEWGYGGSGPSQLALAILCDHLGVAAGAIEANIPITGDGRSPLERALRLYHEFKCRVVSALPRDGWSLTCEDVEAVLRRIEAERAREGGRT